MKLKTLASNSQRNPQWASTLLGFNQLGVKDKAGHEYNIGWYGCLITAFGNYIGKNPFEVNDILKASGGFVAGSGNLIWGKTLSLGLNQVYQSPYYADAVSAQGLAKMKEFLDAGFPLITHIDFDPSDQDDDMHWVVICGYEGDNFFALDSWTGTYISLDVYGGVKRAVLEYRVYDKKLDIDSGVTVAVEASVFENLVRKSTICDKVAQMLNVEISEVIILGEVAKFEGYRDAVIQKDKQLADAQAKIADLEKVNKEKEDEIKTIQENVKKLLDKANELSDTVKIVTEENKIQADKIVQLQKDVKPQPLFTGWRKKIYDLLIK